MRCVECARENPEHFAFCGQCGTPLVPGVSARGPLAATGEAICGNCGRRNPAIFRFCGACGTPLGQAAVKETVACADCGRRNPQHFRYCAGCGNELARPVVEQLESGFAVEAPAGEVEPAIAVEVAPEPAFSAPVREERVEMVEEAAAREAFFVPAVQEPDATAEAAAPAVVEGVRRIAEVQMSAASVVEKVQSEAEPETPMAAPVEDVKEVEVAPTAEELPRSPIFAPPFLEAAAPAALMSEEVAAPEAAAEQNWPAGVVEPEPVTEPTPVAEPAPVEVGWTVAPSMLGLDGPRPGVEGGESFAQDLLHALEHEQGEEKHGRRWLLAAAAVLLVAAGAGWWAVGHHKGSEGKIEALNPAPVAAPLERPGVNGEASGPSSKPVAGADVPSKEQAGQTGASAVEKTAREGTPAAGNTASAGGGARSQAIPAPPAGEAAGKSAPAAGGAATSSALGVTAGASRGTAANATEAASTESALEDSRTLKGETYLYGKGVAPDCVVAVDNLKAAADAASAKAQSIMGAMYATGHCVPRDVARSYEYFGRALKQQPGNVWVKKNMDTLWDEMSEEQRQKAK